MFDQNKVFKSSTGSGMLRSVLEKLFSQFPANYNIYLADFFKHAPKNPPAVISWRRKIYFFTFLKRLLIHVNFQNNHLNAFNLPHCFHLPNHRFPLYYLPLFQQHFQMPEIVLSLSFYSLNKPYYL